MLAQTHLYLADIALDQVKGKGIYLNEGIFRLGSVLPDFSPYHKLIRHYQDDSLEYIERLVHEIIGSTNINEISFKAGVVSHYLADYFCYPHFNNMTFNSKNILKHINYEMNLNTFVKEYTLDQSKEYKFKDIFEVIQSSNYNNTEDFEEDLRTALGVINNFIINSSLWEPKPCLIF